MKTLLLFTIAGLAVLYAQDPAAAPRKGPGAGGMRRVDLTTMERPIDMYDTVWIEDLTLLEVRDLLKAGKTTALVFGGGMEDNGPYITVSQHNTIVRTMCNSIARKLGNALCAPIVGWSPGVPDSAKSPGSVVISAETFKSVLIDEANSLKAQGFKNVLFMVDHGSDVRPSQEAAKALSEKWAGSGASAYYVPEYYNYHEVEVFEADVLGVHEKRDGYHDDYYTASISVAIDPESARMPERIKAKKTTINGVELNGPKAVEDGKKIMAFREAAAVTAIQKLVK